MVGPVDRPLDLGVLRPLAEGEPGPRHGDPQLAAARGIFGEPGEVGPYLHPVHGLRRPCPEAPQRHLFPGHRDSDGLPVAPGARRLEDRGVRVGLAR
ncbi:hypothetical protein [Streptomyces sp. NPDC047981]|uniref:hypothetical protein n=1 Tax=Streptomyces sp. NPDC047981 TaxID=3154610 RepID=UPI0034296EA8